MAPRKSSRIAAAATTAEPKKETAPKAAKAKKTEAKKKTADAAPKASKKTTKKDVKATATAAASDDDAAAPVSAEVAKASGISVTIEACKTCGGLIKAKNLVKALKGKAEAIINPEEPGKGNFVIRVNGGEPVVELLAMTKPFTPIKELNMEDVIAKVLQAVEKATPAS
jgi:hypothetical protein